MSGNNRRGRGDGGYRKRGDSWELKFEATDPKTGHRKTRWVTFKGTETAARAKLRELVRQADTGGFIATSRQTFGEVLDAWETGLTVSPKTEERWRELIALHIRPALGPLPLRRIGWERVKTFYRDLAEGTKGRALSRSTIKCIHFIVGQVFSLAEREGLISTNPAKLVKLPKSEKQEIQILDKAQVVTVLEKLRGRNPLYRIAALGLATGMRRGEMLALRWKNVDLDRAVIRVEYSLEQTRAKEKGKPPVLRFKPPKTKNGHRSITIPPSMVAELRSLRRSQNEERLKLGLGRTEDGLVFHRLDRETGAYAPLVPNSVTTDWKRAVKALKLPKVSLHAWRHTHASQLIAAGMDVLSISRRLGHGSASITLDVYGHLFKPKDEGASSEFEAAFAHVFTGTAADETGTVSKPIGGN